MPITKEVLRTGTFVDSNGTKVTFTEKDLDTIAANFDEQKGRNKLGNQVPLTIAHPKTDSPAFGWVKRFYRDGKTLLAEFAEIKDKMLTAIKDKTFRAVSIALSPGLVPRHVGVLGGWPPAVSGLKDFQLADIAVEGWEFGEDKDFAEYDLDLSSFENRKIKTVGHMLGSLREWIIEKFGRDVADKTIASWDVDFLKREPPPEPQMTPLTSLEPEKHNLNQGAEMPKSVEELTADVEKMTADMKTVSANLAEAQKKITELEGQLTAANEAKLASEKKAQELEASAKAEAEKTADAADLAAVEDLCREYKVPPAEKEITLATLKTFRGQGEMEFSQADGSKAKMLPRDHYLALLKARPALVSEDMLFTADKVSEPQPGQSKMDQLIAEKRKAHPDMPIALAAREVLEEHPELNIHPEKANAPA